MWLTSAKKISVALNCEIDDLYEWIPEREVPGGK